MDALWILVLVCAFFMSMPLFAWVIRKGAKVIDDKVASDLRKQQAAHENVGKPPEVTDALRVCPSGTATARYKCGHTYVRDFAFDFYGDLVELDPKWLAKREKCGDCLLAEDGPHVARCSLCGRYIVPGEGVAAYGLLGEYNPKWLTKTPDGEAAIGCLRMGCCKSGGFFAGHWTRNGFKPLRMANGATIAEHVAATGEPTWVELSDSREPTIRTFSDIVEGERRRGEEERKKKDS